MRHFAHKLCNTELLPPEGAKDVEPLFVTRGTMSHGDGEVRVVRSYWKPSPEDLAELNKGGCITLTLIGDTHAPLFLGVAKTEYMVPELKEITG